MRRGDRHALRAATAEGAPGISGQLHLLQRWTQWIGFDGEPITTLAQVEELCARCAESGHDIRTRTTRRPRRDVTGGCVYFVSSRGLIVFRMPLLRIGGIDTADGSGFYFIMDAAGLRLTAPRRAGFLRGWRYLTDAPPDLPNNTDELPEHMRRELRELGL